MRFASEVCSHGGELVGGSALSFVKAPLFVGLAVGGGSVPNRRDVPGFAIHLL